MHASAKCVNYKNFVLIFLLFFLIIFFQTYDITQENSFEEFQFYCCPKCHVRTKSKEDFVKHTLEEHPAADPTALEAAEQLLQLSVQSPLQGPSALASALMESDEIPFGIILLRLSACST